MSNNIKTLVLVSLTSIVTLICLLLPAAKIADEAGVVLSLPESIRTWGSESVAPSEAEKKILPESTLQIKRIYFPSGSSAKSYAAVSLSLVISAGDERSIHKPEICMDAQGWALLKSEIKTITVGSEEIKLTDITLQRVVDGNVIDAHYYYFFIAKDVTVPTFRKMKWASLYDSFVDNVHHRWAYPGVFTYVNPNVENPQEEAWQRVKMVLEGAVPHFFRKNNG